MRGEGLEPSRLTAYAPQTYVSAIPPPALESIFFKNFLPDLVYLISSNIIHQTILLSTRLVLSMKLIKNLSI